MGSDYDRELSLGKVKRSAREEVMNPAQRGIYQQSEADAFSALGVYIYVCLLKIWSQLEKKLQVKLD